MKRTAIVALLLLFAGGAKTTLADADSNDISVDVDPDTPGIQTVIARPIGMPFDVDIVIDQDDDDGTGTPATARGYQFKMSADKNVVNITGGAPLGTFCTPPSLCAPASQIIQNAGGSQDPYGAPSYGRATIFAAEIVLSGPPSTNEGAVYSVQLECIAPGTTSLDLREPPPDGLGQKTEMLSSTADGPEVTHDAGVTQGPPDEPGITCEPQADLRVYKDHAPAEPPAGTDVTYHITVWNEGPNPAYAVVVTDGLAENKTFVSDTSPYGCAPAPTPPAPPNTWVCPITDPMNPMDTLAPGAMVQFDVVAHIEYTGTGSLNENTVSVQSINPATFLPVTTDPNVPPPGVILDDATFLACLNERLADPNPLDPADDVCDNVWLDQLQPEPASVSIEPAADTNPVGTQHTVTATLRGVGGNPVVGEMVNFSVSGANSASGSDVTDSDGKATFTYRGEATSPPDDQIRATANVDGTDVEDTATKTWGAVPHGGFIFPFAGGSVGDGFTATVAPLSYPSDVAVFGSGGSKAVYVADAGHNRVRTISAGGLAATVAGNGNTAPPWATGDGGPAEDAALFEPRAIALDSAGNLFIAEYQGNRIRRVDAATEEISTVAGTDTGCVNPVADGVPATNASLCDPAGLAFDGGTGDLYVAEAAGHRVRKIATGGDGFITGETNELIETVAGSNAGTPGTADGGSPLGATLNGPRGIAFDAIGDLFIADSGNHAIRKVSGGTISTVAGTIGTSGSSGEGVPATSALLDSPGDLLFDGNDLLVLDSGNHKIRRIAAGSPTTIDGAPDETITTEAGTGFATGSIDGPGGDPNDDLGEGLSPTSASFSSPAGLAFDGADVLVADRENHLVRRISPGSVSTIAGRATDHAQSYCGDGMPAIGTCLGEPSAVTFDVLGDAYIADRANNRIRHVDEATSAVSTFAGGGQDPNQFCGDGGPPENACLDAPSGIALTAGDLPLFIADSGNHVIRRVSLTISTYAGGPDMPGFVDGPPGDARFHTPVDVAIDAAGNVFVADQGNNRVRKIPTGGGNVLTVAGTGACNPGVPPTNGVAATAADLCQPSGLAFDGDGNLYVSDRGHHTVIRINVGANGTVDGATDAGETIVTVAGNGTAGFDAAEDGGPATSASLNLPTGVLVDTAPGHLHLLIADSGNHRVRVVTPSPSGDEDIDGDADELIFTPAGTGVAAFCGAPDPGPPVEAHPAVQACLNGPEGLGMTDDGTLFIADTLNGRVRKLETDSDLDGLTDWSEDNLYLTDRQDSDSDDDGCADSEEVGDSENLGGRRDPVFDPDSVAGSGLPGGQWDFFDVPLPVGEPGTGTRDKQVDGNDALAVLAKFGATPGDPVPSAPKYDPAYDRSAPAPDPWDTGAPEGVSDGNDVVWALAQFGHSCVPPP